ncbi:MAG: PQQ-binding-like beta-propeller repeat protein [Chloroflexi bacterium]|nr:PQQ-binding-like beta-propeller repeat protein [Chloroflexota bacterium]
MKSIWTKGLVAALALALLVTGCFGARVAPGWAGAEAANDVVYYASSAGKVYSLDALSGAQRWVYPVEEKENLGALFARPIVAGELLLVGSGDKNLYALNVSDGQLRWRFLTGGSIYGAAAAQDQMVYVASSDRQVYALEASTGAKKWSFETGNWVWSAPLVAEGRVYVSSMDHKVYCLDASTGQKIWEYSVGAAMAGTPSYAEGMILVGALDSKVHALDAQTGAPKWSFETARKPFLNWKLPAGRWFWGQPLVVDQVVFAGSLNGKVYALELATGQELWQADLEGPVLAGFAHNGEYLYAVTEKGDLYRIDGAQQPVKLASAGGTVFAQPVVNNQIVYLPLSTGSLLAVDAGFGAERWRFSPK